MADAAIAFIHGLGAEDIPAAVRDRASELLLDLIGVACAGSNTALSKLARNHAAAHFGTTGKPARLLLDGRAVSALGAAWSGAATIDSYDAHDGHALTKGHAGVVLLPSLLALSETEQPMSGTQFMCCLVIGYEIATRAGMALHASSSTYHCSGAWNALGVAAMSSRVMALDANRTAEALGIADYHAPRGGMLRGVDHPTMVKDGAGAGAMAGIQAAWLARSGFTGAPAEIMADQPVWQDLGARWRTLEQYVKPYPVCRWAQPAIEAAADLKARHRFAASDIQSIVVETFHEATRLAHACPSSTEQAQYSLPFPLAALLVHDDLAPNRVAGGGLGDPEVLDLARRVKLVRQPEFDAEFPAKRRARVIIHLHSGLELISKPHEPRGEPDAPLSNQALMTKFDELARPVLGQRYNHVLSAVGELWHGSEMAVADLASALLTR